MSDRERFEKAYTEIAGAACLERIGAGYKFEAEREAWELWQAALAQGGETVAPFVLGNSYQTLSGEWVRFVKVHNKGSSYETMADESGVNRYTNRPGDMGRVTARPVDYPGNVPPLYTHPGAPVPEAKEMIDRVVSDLETGFVACARCGDQEDTATLDCMTDLKRLQAMLTTTPQPADNWIKCSDALPEPAPKTRNNRYGILVRFDNGRIERFSEVTEFLVNFMRNGPRLPMKFETPVPARATHWMEITPPEQESE